MRIAHADRAARRIGKGKRMAGVEHLAQRLLTIQIDEYNYLGKVHAEQ